MSLLQDDSMRRQTWHILGWPGVRLGGWSFWRLDMPRQGGGVGTFMPIVISWKAEKVLVAIVLATDKALGFRDRPNRERGPRYQNRCGSSLCCCSAKMRRLVVTPTARPCIMAT